jgi:hypothetical protein
MNISSLILAAIAVLLSGAVAFGPTMAVRAYLRYRGKRVITSPETSNHAAVHVNVVNAAREAVFGKHDIRLDQCSCWPERQNCGQECLSQIKADPEGCMVWHMVDDWYKGKSYAYCQKPFGEIHRHDRQPALLGSDRNTAQWSEIPPENWPAVFQNFLSVCWSCFIAENYRRQPRSRLQTRVTKKAARTNTRSLSRSVHNGRFVAFTLYGAMPCPLPIKSTRTRRRSR